MTDRPAATGLARGGRFVTPRPRPRESKLQDPATAVLDEAHVGDIQGAFGTVAAATPRSGTAGGNDC